MQSRNELLARNLEAQLRNNVFAAGGAVSGCLQALPEKAGFIMTEKLGNEKENREVMIIVMIEVDEARGG